jgi:hypothetical protein
VFSSASSTEPVLRLSNGHRFALPGACPELVEEADTSYER